jgi:hypothetical protein
LSGAVSKKVIEETERKVVPAEARTAQPMNRDGRDWARP